MEDNLIGFTFCVRTYGCQMNKHDSERVVGMLEGLGALPVHSFEEADIAIFMTCCVREAADVRLMGQVASLKNVALRKNSPCKKRIIAIGGCIGQRDGESLVSTLSHVDVVFGTHNLRSLPRLLSRAREGLGYQIEILQSSDSFPTDLPSAREHSWGAWLPITIGCDNFCTYCIVPHVRGREKSRRLEDIEAEARSYYNEGVKEISLLGQNVNSYGRDLYGSPKFTEVLKRVDATGIERLRFATSHPKDLSDGLIEQFASLPSLMPALHLPMQSGSNSILKAMNRKYTKEHYLGLVEKLRSLVPDIALSTDIIVGFPGETEKDFEDTYHLVEEIGFTQVFTFIYSKREGTPAANMMNAVPYDLVRMRFDKLVELVQRRAYELAQSDTGKIVDVLVEGVSKRDPMVASGRSRHNRTVHFPLKHKEMLSEIKGKIVPVKVRQAKTWYLFGDIHEGNGV